MTTPSGLRSSTTLDLLRAVAALAVFDGYTRSLLYVDSAQIGERNCVTDVSYLATSFGYTAVMLFFVPSGFLIGSVVQRDLLQRCWSWGGYFVDRTVRLAVVAVPALVLTAVLDQVGQSVGDSRVYDGGHPSNTLEGKRLSECGTPAVFLANLGFLQTIVAPTFGTNGPLWSLANSTGITSCSPSAGWPCSASSIGASGYSCCRSLLASGGWPLASDWDRGFWCG